MVVGEGGWFVPADGSVVVSGFRAAWCGLLYRLVRRRFHVQWWVCRRDGTGARSAWSGWRDLFQVPDVHEEQLQEVLFRC